MKTNFNNYLYLRFTILIVFVVSFFIGCTPELHYIDKHCTSMKGGLTVDAWVNQNAFNNYEYIDFGGTRINKDEIRKIRNLPYRKLQFEVPAWPIPETIKVYVVTDDDRSNSFEFTYTEDIEIFRIEPNKGSELGGTFVTIRGRNFKAPADASLHTEKARVYELDDLKVISESEITGYTKPHVPEIVHLFLTCDTEDCPSSDTLWQCYEYIADPYHIFGAPLGIDEPIKDSYQYVAIDDMNNDHRNDIVVVSSDIAAVNVQVINGIDDDPISTLGLPHDSKPSGVALGDFDLSGSVDIAVALEELGVVAVIFNDGSGIISGYDLIDVGGNPKAIIVNDLDGDGNIDDIATANSPGSSVSIMIGKDDGSFETAIEIPISGGSTSGKPNELVSIAAANLDGVGNLDLAITNKSNNEAIILFNPGSSVSYLGEYIKESLIEPVWVAGFDYNFDGKIDLSTLDYRSANLSYWENLGSSSFGGHKGLHLEIANPVVLTVNGDLLTIAFEDCLVGGKKILESSYDYKIKLPVKEGDHFKGFILSMATGDLDGDGTADIVVGMRDYGAIFIIRSTETHVF
ncbi:MAG: IPT/TIG domain-containing protein [Ignavibacteriales bacterium]|nr:MAG: IPT/TIG domain-containing protein [Ignavibacteriales bacterium]